MSQTAQGSSIPVLHSIYASPVADGRGHQLSWRRLGTNAEGQADLALVGSSDAAQAVYAIVPVDSPEAQQARLVIDTPLEVSAWFNGKPVAVLSGEPDFEASHESHSSICPEGSSKLLMRLDARVQRMRRRLS